MIFRLKIIVFCFHNTKIRKKYENTVFREITPILQSSLSSHSRPSQKSKRLPPNVVYQSWCYLRRCFVSKRFARCNLRVLHCQKRWFLPLFACLRDLGISENRCFAQYFPCSRAVRISTIRNPNRWNWHSYTIRTIRQKVEFAKHYDRFHIVIERNDIVRLQGVNRFYLESTCCCTIGLPQFRASAKVPGQ